MTRMARGALGAALAGVLIAAFAVPGGAAPSTRRAAAKSWLGGPGHRLHRGHHGEVDVNVCSDAVAPGVARCQARARADLFGAGAEPRQPGALVRPGDVAQPDALGNQGAYDPAFLRSAYNAPPAGGLGQTVAIVDAFDAPNLESDLAFYRSFFGLPPCTTANGCFRKIDQNGGTKYPAYNPSWATETTLDAEMVSAICPYCHILVVEASSAFITSLGRAVNTAVAHGANVVSNSYGADEFAGEQQFNSEYDHPGVAIVASSGDTGFGLSYPASAPATVAAGGTTLVQNNGTGTRDATETAWSGAGSGCSAFEAKPAWQHDSGCSSRSVADVAAVADPSTGVWVFSRDDGGWEVFGGTSVAAPIVSAFYALAENPASTADVASYPYTYAGSLNDVTSGSNGTCGSYLCDATAGYDGPTGLGTPNTAAAFSATGTSPPPPSPIDLPPIQNPDFTINAAKLAGPMRPGVIAKSTVTLAPVNGFGGTVELATLVTPHAGLSASIRRAPVAIGTETQTTPLTLHAYSGGTYKVTVFGFQGDVTRKKTITVYVNDFSMRPTPKRATVVRGQTARYTLALKSMGSLRNAITLAAAGRLANRVAFSHNPGPASGTVTVAIPTSTKDAPGLITLRFTGMSGAVKHSVLVTLLVQ